MYQNTIYICIFWYSKICWFAVKKSWCQQNSRDRSRDSYIFGCSLVNCDEFHHCGICVTNFREEGACLLPPPPIREQLRKSQSWIELTLAWKSTVQKVQNLSLEQIIIDISLQSKNHLDQEKYTHSRVNLWQPLFYWGNSKICNKCKWRCITSVRKFQTKWSIFHEKKRQYYKIRLQFNSFS